MARQKDHPVGKPVGLILPDLPVLAEPAAYLTVLFRGACLRPGRLAGAFGTPKRCYQGPADHDANHSTPVVRAGANIINGSGRSHNGQDRRVYRCGEVTGWNPLIIRLNGATGHGALGDRDSDGD
jgi:hypothetical protein